MNRHVYLTWQPKERILNLSDIYIAHIHHAWSSRRSNYYPGSARQPNSALTAFKELLPTGTHLTPGWKVANVD